MGEVAYKLELPEGLSGVHDVFHVSQLKKCHAEMADIPLIDTVPLEAIQLDSDLTYEEKPVKILEFANRITRRRLSSFAKFSGATIPRMKPPGNERNTYGKTTHTSFLANPNLEGEIHLKGGRFVTSQFLIWMLYIGHHMHIIFYLHFGCDPRNPKQLKDPRRELGISFISYLNFLKFEKRII